jgi:hypothetical protein
MQLVWLSLDVVAGGVHEAHTRFVVDDPAELMYCDGAEHVDQVEQLETLLLAE